MLRYLALLYRPLKGLVYLYITFLFSLSHVFPNLHDLRGTEKKTLSRILKTKKSQTKNSFRKEQFRHVSKKLILHFTHQRRKNTGEQITDFSYFWLNYPFKTQLKLGS